MWAWTTLSTHLLWARPHPTPVCRGPTGLAPRLPHLWPHPSHCSAASQSPAFPTSPCSRLSPHTGSGPREGRALCQVFAPEISQEREAGGWGAGEPPVLSPKTLPSEAGRNSSAIILVFLSRLIRRRCKLNSVGVWRAQRQSRSRQALVFCSLCSLWIPRRSTSLPALRVGGSRTWHPVIPFFWKAGAGWRWGPAGQRCQKLVGVCVCWQLLSSGHLSLLNTRTPCQTGRVELIRRVVYNNHANNGNRLSFVGENDTPDLQ